MMPGEKYSLSWDNYSNHLKEMLHEMLKSNELADVTLVCDDNKQIKAHKLVLSACSTVFKAIISALPQSNPVIYLRGIQSQELESILQFIYIGETTFHHERMREFLNVAKALEVKEISENIADTQKLIQDTDDSEELESNLLEAENLETENIDRKKHKKMYLVSSHECSECGKSLRNPRNLKRHLESIHNGLKYPCDQCDFNASQKYHLKSHIKAKHTKTNSKANSTWDTDIIPVEENKSHMDSQ